MESSTTTRPSRLRRAVSLIAVAAMMVGGIAVSPVMAQTGVPAPAGDDSAVRQEFDSLFEQTLRDPANLTLTLRYAEAATRLGDFEAAITALERILFFNPNLPQARLELGVLYYRLGSLTTARAYLEEARRSGELPPEQLARVDEYLRQIAASEERHRVTGRAFAGIQHQTNANLGPGSSDIRALGFTATLAPNFVKKKDQSLVASGSALYSYDFQDQDRDALEVTAAAYASKHFRVRSFDLDYIDVTIGPRSSLATWGLTGFSIKPYLIASYVQLGRNPYYHGYGAGLEAVQAVTPDILVKGSYEHREKNFEDAPDRLNSRQLTGHDDILALTGLYALTPDQLLGLNLSYLRQSTRVNSQSNQEFAALASYQIDYAVPFDWPEGQWQTSVYAGRSAAFYDAPDPIVDPVARRADRRWRFGITETIPVVDGVGVMIQLQRDVVSSSLPNFAFTSNSVLVGPQLRF